MGARRKRDSVEPEAFASGPAPRALRDRKPAVNRMRKEIERGIPVNLAAFAETGRKGNGVRAESKTRRDHHAFDMVSVWRERPVRLERLPDLIPPCHRLSQGPASGVEIMNVTHQLKEVANGRTSCGGDVADSRLEHGII